MKLKTILFSLMLSGLALSVSASSPRHTTIIPKPLSVTPQAGEAFRLTPRTTISYDEAAKAQAEYLQEVLGRSTGWDLRLKPGRKGTIRLTVDSVAVPRAEGYRLTVKAKGVEVCGHDAAGVFYGLQTLLQLFPEQVYSRERQKGVDWTAEPVEVADAPNQPWRGMMLDVARYFFHKDFVKKYIDMMAMYKLNKLQFHLIDDSGWRLEIKKYPRLTEVGAWAGTDANRLGGFYTQDDIREIIAYAAVRGVEVIPEIEFPAHIMSAVVAYPWLSCTGVQHELPTQHFISRELLCVGKETSLQFLRDVLDETISLFPSRYLNIGGDEAVYTRWETCPDCQALMKREGLDQALQLQGWLTNQVAGWLKEKGRTAIGWEEVFMRGHVGTPLVGLMWHNVGDTIKAKEAGHQSILTPATHMYFDFPETRTPGEPQYATWMPPISLEKVYSMPVEDYSSASSNLGVQGCLWSDQFIHGDRLQEIAALDENRSENYAEYFTFPRLLALSELGWSRKADRNYADFRARLGTHFARLDHKDCNYRIPEPEVERVEQNDNGWTFTLRPNVPGAEIRYTTNGSYPNVHSPLYTTPVTVENKADFLAINVLGTHRYSRPFLTPVDYSAYKSYGEFTAEWKPLQVQPTASPWHFDATGKISGNGEYEITFIRLRGDNGLQLGELQVLKHDEVVASLPLNAVVSQESPVVQAFFPIDCFEAGTPFRIRVTACGQGGNDTAGLVFVRRK